MVLYNFFIGLMWQFCDVATHDCSNMLDEVDVLHVKRNTFSGDELLSYIGFLFRVLFFCKS
jgi:hypothetical protein